MAKADHTQPTGCIVKQITIGEHYYPPLKHQCRSRPVPWLQLKGYWLQDLGFEQRSQVTIRAMAGCLVLTVLPES